MNWEAIGAVGEALGAAGVILSLLYLAVQIRGDARAKRTEVVHQQSEAFRSFLHILATNREIADIYHRGLADFKSLKDEELVRFSTLLGYLFRVYEENFYQWREGVLDAHIWHGLKSPIHDILAYPGAQDWWATRSHWFSLDFRQFVQEQLTTSNVPGMYGESGT